MVEPRAKAGSRTLSAVPSLFLYLPGHPNLGITFAGTLDKQGDGIVRGMRCVSTQWS